MITKQERTQSNAQQNKDKHRTTTTNGKHTKQRSTTTEPPPYNGQQPKPSRGLNAFNWYQIFALDSVVVKTQIICLAWKLLN